MSRLPPALLYLTIYNPTLRPSAPPRDDDEDAEEQAQILFYTAREHAVSRDRILRQVGLAKALINFSDMFADEECEDVHSQSRRMIMVSPEPGFWMHACLELSKTPRSALPSKGKEKEKGKGKAKAKDPKAQPEPVFDYHDGAVSDAALRAHLLRAHQTFQLTHGSFTSILRDLGQQALELQLERFFTPWAWNWDIEQDAEFGSYLGPPTHPSYRIIVPLLDDFHEQSLLPETAVPFIMVPPHIIPSTAYTTTQLPSVLPLHLRKRIPPPPPKPDPPAPEATSTEQEPREKVDGTSTPGAADAIVEGTREAFNATGNAFVAVGNAMDVRRWNWGYLTFGKSSTAKIGDQSTANASAETSTAVEAGKESSAQGDDIGPNETSADSGAVDEGARTGADVGEALSLPEVPVDRESLIDAMGPLGVEAQEPAPPDATSRDDSSPASDESALDATPAFEASHDEPPSPVVDAQPPLEDAAPVGADTGARPESPGTSPSTSEPIELPPTPPPSPLLKLQVHIADPDYAENTLPRNLLYRTYDGLALGLLTDPESEASEADTLRLSSLSSKLLRDTKKALDENDGSSPQTPLYSATKILQPKDKFVFTKGQGRSLASADFASRSEHLFAAQELVSNADILEVYSRTQGPQHWNAARREQDAAVFMEVSRKETSLTDVEDELLGVLRRCRDAA